MILLESAVGILLIGSTFLTAILVGVVLLAFNLGMRVHKHDTLNQQRFNELKGLIDGLQKLFVEDVNVILDKIKGILKQK